MLGKCLEWGCDRKPHHLPMPCHRILSGTCLIQLHIVSPWFFHGFHTLQGMKICHTKLLQIGYIHSLYTPGNVPQSIRPLISIGRRILHGAHSQRINHNCKDPFILIHFHPSKPKNCYNYFNLISR